MVNHAFTETTPITKSPFFSTDIQGVNYVGGLARLNHMVSTSNLSEITSFMPGIKTLLQLGMQLKV